MKVGLFTTVRGGVPRFVPFIKEGMNLELVDLGCPPNMDTLGVLKEKGCEAMIYTSDHMETAEFFQGIADCGVKYVCTCSAGYNHFNVPAMKEAGLKGANVPAYSPNAVSEYAVMMVLAALRHLKKQIRHADNGIFQLNELLGRELRNMEVGIVGAGRIGYTTMRCLSGFGPKKIYAYDPYPNDKVKEYAEYVTLEELNAKSDVIIYHASVNDSNYHMVNRDSLAQMKDGVVLVNAARGELFDVEAVLWGVESGKIGALALDVIEEEYLLRKSPKFEKCPIPVLGRLIQYDNVIFTPHAAFFTDVADHNLAEGTVQNLDQYEKTGSCDNERIQIL